MTQKRLLLLIFGALILVCVAIIWGNSMTPGIESGEMSGSFTEWINGVVQTIFPSVTISHKFVRKAAHFTEFAVLGALICAELFVWLYERKRALLLLSIPCCFLVALTDEFIQKFTEGRASSFVDVLIDTSGATVAVLIFFGVVILNEFLRKRFRRENT